MECEHVFVTNYGKEGFYLTLDTGGVNAICINCKRTIHMSPVDKEERDYRTSENRKKKREKLITKICRNNKKFNHVFRPIPNHVEVEGPCGVPGAFHTSICKACKCRWEETIMPQDPNGQDYKVSHVFFFKGEQSHDMPICTRSV